MNELTLVRALRSEQDEPTAAALTAGRAALFERIAVEVEPNGEPVPKAAVHRRRRALRGLSALGVGALLAGLVLTDIVGLAGWRGGADAAAAAVLERAAVSAITFADPELGPGQYLHIESELVHPINGAEEDGEVFHYLNRARSELFVPADRDDDWVWVRPPVSLVRVLTPGAEEKIARYYEEVQEGGGELLRAPGGSFYGLTSDSQWGDYDDMPRDPYRLLNHIYRITLGAGSSPDGQALVFIADTLRQGTAPADLRAALLRAAALIPGVTITDDHANLDGERGIAIGRLEERNGLRNEIIIDPDSGRLIGEREITVTGDPDSGLPAGAVYSWSSVRTDVRDAAPAGGTPNGSSDERGCIPSGFNGEWTCPPPEED